VIEGSAAVPVPAGDEHLPIREERDRGEIESVELHSGCLQERVGRRIVDLWLLPAAGNENAPTTGCLAPLGSPDFST
jgi:hypothetical protein